MKGRSQNKQRDTAQIKLTCLHTSREQMQRDLCGNRPYITFAVGCVDMFDLARVNSVNSVPANFHT